MKKLIICFAAIFMVTGCSLITEAGLSIQKGISTTGDAVTSTSDNTTKASKSSSGSDDNNWEYDEGKSV